MKLDLWYNFCYTRYVKTAISIPDHVFNTAEELADRLGKSRSQLYTQALSSYLAKHRNQGVTTKLNQVYSSENSKLNKQLADLQLRSLPKGKW